MVLTSCSRPESRNSVGRLSSPVFFDIPTSNLSSGLMRILSRKWMLFVSSLHGRATETFLNV